MLQPPKWNLWVPFQKINAACVFFYSNRIQIEMWKRWAQYNFFPQFALEPRFDPTRQLWHHVLDESPFILYRQNPIQDLAQYRQSLNVSSVNELPVGSWSWVRCQASCSFADVACLRVTSLFWCLTWLCLLSNGLKDIPCVSSSAGTHFTIWLSACRPKARSLVHVWITAAKKPKRTLKDLWPHPPSPPSNRATLTSLLQKGNTGRTYF